ncbi:tRNA adenosine(34) deaminase TadA [Desulfovermiculus halophilus]|uniref:tRNA adenosine(34) deaminase TadA n=1 Tax=Desulfovermiculus halophilus TaxID=339722 RepID=UPI00048882BB|nr:tRNA adenosine(34) deaminase TadA [Desulfovermiculus halophilus]
MKSEVDWTFWMQAALKEARNAEMLDEVPVGALVLDANLRVLGSGHNTPISSQDPTAHAEIVALRRACRRQGNYRLTGSVIVCTLEPCCMCAGALVQARISGIVFGARDPKAGALVSRMHFPQDYGWLNHSFWIQEGVCDRECSQLLQSFFARRRSSKTGQ